MKQKTTDITHYRLQTKHRNSPSRKKQKPTGITRVHTFELFSDAYFHDSPFEPVKPTATCIPLASLHDTALISQVIAAFAILASQVSKFSAVEKQPECYYIREKKTMRRQTLGVPITTRQHIHHHKCWQAVIGIPSACADRPSTKVHKTCTHTSASRYVSSYSHLPPAILKHISRSTHEENEAKGSRQKTQ
jgi:hypothetical protein